MDIQVNDVSKIYGTGENKVVALCHANMTIHSGDFISIMGPSGSGKSTLLHIISGWTRQLPARCCMAIPTSITAVTRSYRRSAAKKSASSSSNSICSRC